MGDFGVTHTRSRVKPVPVLVGMSNCEQVPTGTHHITSHHIVTTTLLSLPTTASTAAAANADEGDDDGMKDQYNTTRDTGGEIMRAGGRCKIHFLSFIKFIGTDYPPNQIGK